MDESRKAWEEWMKTDWSEFRGLFDCWQAAIAWDREYLAGLAESCGNAPFLLAWQIRAGKIEGRKDQARQNREE